MFELRKLHDLTRIVPNYSGFRKRNRFDLIRLPTLVRAGRRTSLTVLPRESHAADRLTAGSDAMTDDLPDCPATVFILVPRYASACACASDLLCKKLRVRCSGARCQNYRRR